MEDNKLIAEFMGAIGTPKYNPTEWDIYITGCLDVDSDDENAKHFYTPEEMKYHTSWDWLMPVIQRITDVISPFDEQDEQLFSQTLLYKRIDDVYKLVVEFIKEYNKINK